MSNNGADDQTKKNLAIVVSISFMPILIFVIGYHFFLMIHVDGRISDLMESNKNSISTQELNIVDSENNIRIIIKANQDEEKSYATLLILDESGQARITMGFEDESSTSTLVFLNKDGGLAEASTVVDASGEASIEEYADALDIIEIVPMLGGIANQLKKYGAKLMKLRRTNTNMVPGAKLSPSIEDLSSQPEERPANQP